MNHSSQTFEVHQTEFFRKWLAGLKDKHAKVRVLTRLERVQRGLLGDANFFEGIGELRIPYGPGYRLYFVQRGETVIFLLNGGDKSSQRRDIEKAKDIARRL
ncbi:type II toxin-antitoxin system RelE/ParE family toxin [Fodinicurvata sediminis]|uniref:type II toxin-antitoxin system RelE/ParE family toxin n=1 Tax=Fodinicurvata sediminis TaxID=1121832 RepID=UPI0003B3E91F|nr:type II toxin-antitoxin system RelE/ParE family toxin [Fodinicurvata sediminis]